METQKATGHRPGELASTVSSKDFLLCFSFSQGSALQHKLFINDNTRLPHGSEEAELVIISPPQRDGPLSNRLNQVRAGLEAVQVIEETEPGVSEVKLENYLCSTLIGWLIQD